MSVCVCLCVCVWLCVCPFFCPTPSSLVSSSYILGKRKCQCGSVIAHFPYFSLPSYFLTFFLTFSTFLTVFRLFCFVLFWQGNPPPFTIPLVSTPVIVLTSSSSSASSPSPSVSSPSSSSVPFRTAYYRFGDGKFSCFSFFFYHFYFHCSTFSYPFLPRYPLFFPFPPFFIPTFIPIFYRIYLRSGTHCFLSIMREEGIRGLYQGLSVNLIRGIGGAILLVGYDEAKAMLKTDTI